jgi:NAD-dependent DNA ligase
MEEFIMKVTKEMLDEYTRAWSHGNALIDDADFDALVEQYVKENGEEARPFMRVKKPDGIADIPNQTLSKVYGVQTPMRKGQKTYADWINAMDNVDCDQMVAVQAKFDGVSVTWDIRENKWFTRGDYDNGESMDITYLFGGRFVHMSKMLAPEYQNPIAIKFEAIMATDIFEALGLNQKYVNPRAAVSAIIMSRDKKYVGYIKLIQLRYYYEDGRVLIPDYDIDAGHGCCAYQFMPYDNYELIEHFIGELLDRGAKVDLTTDEEGNVHTFEIDGVVVSFFSQADGGDAELVQPLTEIAIKILNNVKETRIKNIEWQMGKTGKITPVGILEPVRFDNGITVDHVGLSTFERVLNLNLHFNETVRVMHNIVPYLLDGKGDGDMRIPTPTKCPICGKLLDMSNLRTVRCTNPECQSKKLGDIVRYCETMKMMGLSKGILTKLYDMGYVQSIPDLYKIDYQRLALEKGFAETSCNAIRKSIEASSVNVTPDQWFGALPCLNVSQKTWKTIFDTHLRDDEEFFSVLIDEIDNDDCEGFLQTLIQPMLGVGPATWGAIAECFRNNWKDIRETICHIRFLLEYDEKKGELICLSGTRDSSLVNALTLAGYRVTDDWSSEVNILLIPHEGYMSSKVKKALKHMVPIYTADDALLNIINHGKIK